MWKFAPLLMMLAAPVMAAECYTNEIDPNVTMTKTADGFEMNQSGKKTVLLDMTGGTGVPFRALVTEDMKTGFKYMHHGNDLIVDMYVFTAGCKK